MLVSTLAKGHVVRRGASIHQAPVAQTHKQMIVGRRDAIGAPRGAFLDESGMDAFALVKRRPRFRIQLLVR